MSDHQCFTVDRTTYLRNIDPDDLGRPCFAVHYQSPPGTTERGTSIGLRLPILLISGYLEEPEKVAQKVASILEKHWNEE